MVQWFARSWNLHDLSLHVWGKKSEGMAFRLIGDWLLIWVCYPCDELLTCPGVYPVSQSVKAGIGWSYPVHLEPITKMLIFSLRYLVGLYSNLIHFCIYNYWNVFGLRSGHWLGCWKISDLLAPRNSCVAFAVYFGSLTVCILSPVWSVLQLLAECDRV